MFTGQQLLQQALAQHQAMRLPEGHPQPMEAHQSLEVQPPVKPDQTPEQQYQAVFHRQIFLLHVSTVK